jgi:hypothetical protein
LRRRYERMVREGEIGRPVWYNIRGPSRGKTS